MRLTQTARQISLLRLLLLALALAVVVLTVEGRQRELAPEAVWLARALLAGVALAAAGLVVAVPWTIRAWQLVLHLVFDLLWIGVLVWITGGVASPAVPLLFAVVVISTLALPGVAPFIMPALAGLALGVVASLTLARITPLTEAFIEAHPGVGDTNRIIAQLAIQVGALFVVDLLGQLLAKRQGEQRLYTRELLDQLGEGVIAVDHHGVVAYVNDEAVRLLGLTSNDPTGQPVAEVLQDAALANLLKHLVEPGKPTVERLIGPAGRHLVIRISPLHGKGGAIIGRTLLAADETRLRLLEENARRAEHLASLGEMAAGIAHEVRNPLASLRGCAQELSDMNRQSGDHDARALSAILVSEADRLARIVDDFLSFSRMRATVRDEVEPSPLLAEIRRLLDMRSDLPQGLSLALTADPDCPPLHADRGQLIQVLLNLLNNALDAVRGVACPSVRCRMASCSSADSPLEVASVEIRIEDNGCGIDEKTRERLFTPFFSTKAQGTGLGLALVSRIIREHEGTLDVVSQPGVGSSFRIHLPARSFTREFRRVAASAQP